MSVLRPLGLPVYLRSRDPKLLTNVYGGPRQEVTAYFTGPGQIALLSAVPGRLIVGPSIHAKSGRAPPEEDLSKGVPGMEGVQQIVLYPARIRLSVQPAILSAGLQKRG